MSDKLNDPTKRPWYSFHWRIIFWILLPLICITLIDSLAMLIAVYRDR
jgi:hypothetical protein